MKTRPTLSAMSQTKLIPALVKSRLSPDSSGNFFAGLKTRCLPVAMGLLAFTALLSFSKNSFACYANFYPMDSGGVVYFDNASQASNTAYWYWTFGDGTSSDLENPVHAYNSYGPFLVCLTVYDTANNCTDTHCDSLYLSACQASFTYTISGTLVEFTNTSQPNDAVYWTWDFGDGTSSNLQNPSHEYSNYAYYTVCLSMHDSVNNCNSTYCAYINLTNGNGCLAQFYYIDSADLVYFYNYSQASNSAYWFWTFGDGTSSDQENPIHQYNGFGQYWACLTVYDTANNCTSTYCDSVYLNNNGGGCQAYFLYSENGLTVDFINYSAGNYTSVLWNFGDNNISYFNNPEHTYSNSGYYYVCVTVSDTGNNCNDTYCQNIYVTNDTSQMCSPSFTYSVNGTEVHFINTSMGCNTTNWYWQFGDGGTSGNFDPWHQYASAGYYYVCLSMYDSICGCSDSICQVVYVGGNNNLCNAEFVLYPDSFQQGLYWGYNYSIGNNLIYYWWWGDGAFSTGQYPSHTYADSGYYTICLSIYDTISACSDSFCSNYYIMKQSKMMGMHEVIFVNATGVPPVQPDPEIHWSIFPNPASDNIHIQTNAEKIDKVRITDLSGKELKEINSYTGEPISLESLSQEVYIVQAFIQGAWSSKLLIRQ